ncbi:MAG TPA: hypothetical protein VGK64_26970 [Bryobacteraceae bacterium]
MTNEQLYLAIGIPSLINIGLISLLYLVLSRQIETTSTALRNEVTALRNEMTARFEAAHQGLLRVEGVLDARLKHLEQSL